MNERLRDRVIALIESHSPYGYREFLEALRADIIARIEGCEEDDTDG